MGKNNLTRQTILSKTSYGMNIYAHILRQFFPEDDVLIKVVGRDCGVCRNPFDEGKRSLKIWIEKEEPGKVMSPEWACHQDLSGAVPDGDCFDFARRYYRLEGQQLYRKISEDLFLRLGYICFTFFRHPITNTVPHKNITLADAYNYISRPYAKDRTEKLRSLSDARRARNYKAAHFDYCTFSGTFESRSDKALVDHSGYLCIDFDHLTDVKGTFEKLLGDRYFETQLLFRSPSGDGLKWVISINTAEVSHEEYFNAVANYLKRTYGLEADKSGKDVSRACFLPYDPEAYINPKNLYKL